jgi:hypothetical protein
MSASESENFGKLLEEFVLFSIAYYYMRLYLRVVGVLFLCGFAY